MRLSKRNLIGQVSSAFSVAGLRPILMDGDHPSIFRVYELNGSFKEFRVYIWNCTHGGVSRAEDEFRIQFTPKSPEIDAQRDTLLLGWHEEKHVFAAWDINKHHQQPGSSPSAQIKEGVLDDALHNGFALRAKDNEIVAAFSPIFIADYAYNIRSIHGDGVVSADMDLLNNIDGVTDQQICGIPNTGRREIIRTITLKYRDRKFRKDVLQAYGHRCAFCGIQLDLIDAAHILPVYAQGSTDHVTNGIALCKLHHFAYDQNLVSITSDYRIEVNAALCKDLVGRGLSSGLDQFVRNLSSTLLLPANTACHPSVAMIMESHKHRVYRSLSFMFDNSFNEA